VVILLTDGSNNRGDISPMTAAEIAKKMGVRVYTIGVGSNNVAPYPTGDGGVVQMPVELDEKTLNDIAATADGKYYRATNNKELAQIYSDIDKLEKSRIDAKKFSKRYEAYTPFAIIALLSLLMEVILRTTYLRRIP